MARGSLRAATQNAYRGAPGATRQGHVHVTLPSGEVASVPVYTAIDVTADPELGARLLDDGAVNSVRLPDGTPLAVSTPVVYHDPGNELMVLVLAESDRHRELAERARLLAEMAADPTTPVPRYAREFAVVFGAAGLRAYLEDKAEKAVAQAREADRARVEIDRLRGEVERLRAELERANAEIELLRADLVTASQPALPGADLTCAGPASLAQGPLEVRLQLHRMPSAPVVTLSLLGEGGARASAVVDERLLAQLGKKFVLSVEVVADGRPVRRVEVAAPLEENAAYILRAAQDHLRSIDRPSVERAQRELADPGYDFLGAQHPDASEFRDDKLGQLATANQVRRALAIARRFSRPSREDYLVTVRGYPLARWHEKRRQVLARAVEWGLWMGPELAQAAVSEGLARSRKDLVVRLQAAFERLLADAVANDLDADAAEDNRKALAEEAQALGLDAQVTSGTIDRPTQPVDPRGRPVEELIAMLDDRQTRLAAALELCDRGDPRGIRPVLHAVRRMPRTEAVRVLGASVKFGDAAAPALTAGLGSSKAFLRHGCALALGMLRTEAGTEAVIDLLLSEPTEIWRELARAVGQIGPPALMPLAARMGRLGQTADAPTRERVAWAMAHIGVRGARGAVETLAGGASVVAPVARHALELMAPAANDDLRGTGPGKEVTVNRAFSKKFFEAVGTRETLLEASSPFELLDEADLIDEDEDELDESDLIES